MKPAICGMCVAVAFAAASVNADMVVFENHGGAFKWQWTDHDKVDGNWLDITQDANQSGAEVAHGVQAFYWPAIFSSVPDAHGIAGGDNSIVAKGTPVPYQHEDGGWFNYTPVATFGHGDAVHAGNDWSGWAAYTSLNAWWDGWHHFISESTYIGVEIELDSGTHYGWIEIMRVEDHAWTESHYQPIRWGYNAIANEAALIPAPGALLLLGLAGLAGRRRRA